MNDETWTADLRKEFPAASTTTFLDIAYGNTGSTFAAKAFDEYIHDWQDVSPTVIKGSAGGKGRQIEVIADTRRRIARLIGGVDEYDIAFTKNTNEGLNLVLSAFPFKPGDNIITDSMEHVNVLMPVLKTKERGVEVRVAEPVGNRINVNTLLDQVDEKTRFIVVSHVEYSTGFRNDLKRIGSFAGERGVYLAVDAIQSLGFIPFDAVDWNVDVVTAATYKGLLGVEGVAFTYVSRPLQNELTPTIVAANPHVSVDRIEWTLDYAKDRDARILENSTVNVPGIYVLNAGLRRLEQIGIQRIAEHIQSLSTRLYAGLKQAGYTIVTPSSPEERCHIISVLVPDPENLYQYLRDHGVFASFSADKYVRFSVAPFSTIEDVDKGVEIASTYSQR